MYALDARVLGVLKGRASWQRGKIRMSMAELQDILLARFPSDGRPARREIEAAIRRLTRIRCLSWAVTTNDGVVFIP